MSIESLSDKAKPFYVTQAEIDATHPMNDGVMCYAEDEAAMHLVGERHGKRELVNLVRTLLMRGRAPDAEFDRAPETSRRQQAVEALIAMGWKWDRTAGWMTPVSTDAPAYHYGLTAGDIDRLRAAGLKPEEIDGDEVKQAQRVGELVRWFARLANRSANPKWATAHAYELAFYVATHSEARKIDISAALKASWLQGVTISDADRGMLERIGAIPARIVQADPATAMHAPLDGKYAEVLRPFLQMMEGELHANATKGDRPGWLAMDRKTALLEIYYHVAKLQKSVKDDSPHGIRENAADVANMAMMLVDVCGLLPVAQEVQ